MWAAGKRTPRANSGILDLNLVVAQAYAHRMLDFEASRLSREADRGIRFEVSVHLGWGEAAPGRGRENMGWAPCLQTALI